MIRHIDGLGFARLPSVTTQTEALGKDGEHLGAPHGERSHQARERCRVDRKEAHEAEQDEDRD